jgi:hypothetical protein
MRTPYIFVLLDPPGKLLKRQDTCTATGKFPQISLKGSLNNLVFRSYSRLPEDNSRQNSEQAICSPVQQHPFPGRRNTLPETSHPGHGNFRIAAASASGMDCSSARRISTDLPIEHSARLLFRRKLNCYLRILSLLKIPGPAYSIKLGFAPSAACCRSLSLSNPYANIGT